LPNIAEWLKTLGAIAGAVALVWRFIDEFGSHLRIAVTVETDSAADGWLTVLTTVDNKGNRPKGIEYAMVLVGPESENPVETARILARAVGYAEPLGYTNDFVGFRVIDPVIQEDRALIQLPFYYQENVDIADETLTYRAALPAGGFRRRMPYGVRFFLFPTGRRLHRSTEDSFVLCDPTDSSVRTE